ncbi:MULTISPECIES: thioredoxin [Candidatus Microthrix]|jgi:thioredoxin 2|uniref:Thioredoxin n=1 Tax=Candidatus Neomicrothrix parvicella RN1 TaxID=1229780 RepID=R4YYN4_9ACTN|nr:MULTISPECIES: thioredoxin [Microthrix]HBX09991.1 thioredoxin [Candidatus Microthrix parvicella]MBK7019877.1 thioredoxin [Candidatus Microthrix sp.]MBK7322863.1 thioredoxin [Candidatus Microthrix sp.]MBP6136486.1 thioredoxin [Candidatus Microthrix sp.]MBP7406271.1 thioredoxin [Candidatus Microthrix sp.]
MSSTVITCPSCTTKNRVPDIASGKPQCAGCHTKLPWLIEVDEAGFTQVVKGSSLPVVVDLWAPWCGPCRMVAPELEKLASERAGELRVVKVNVDEAPGVSARLGVQGIPTLLLFHDGNEVGRQVGALPGPALRSWIDDTLA